MKTKFNTRVLTGTAMLAAVATVLMYMEFPIPIMPAFIKLDVSELPALIASFAYGPVAGIVVCLIKNLIKLPSTSTAAVGELFNFVMGALFVGVAGMVYRFKKTRSGAILGAVLGAFGYGNRQRPVQLLHRLSGLCGHVSSAAGCHHRHVPGH